MIGWAGHAETLPRQCAGSQGGALRKASPFRLSQPQGQTALRYVTFGSQVGCLVPFGMGRLVHWVLEPGSVPLLD